MARKKIYKCVDCPTCGNPITIKLHEKEIQKCQWCRRLFKIDVINKICNVEAIDFEPNFEV